MTDSRQDLHAFAHRYVPAALPAQASAIAAAATTLLLLHGTGGNEESLLQLGRAVAPGANLLGVRGRALDEGFPRFFRRFSATSYDQEQIRSEALALGGFVAAAAEHYGFAAASVLALGYSNGANMALGLLAHAPATVSGAVLLRGVMALDSPPESHMAGKRVLTINGGSDPYAPYAAGLVDYLAKSGASVRAETLAAGHELTANDADLVAAWLASQAGA